MDVSIKLIEYFRGKSNLNIKPNPLDYSLPDGKTLLHSASQSGIYESVKLVLSWSNDISFVNMKTKNLLNALHYVCKSEQSDCDNIVKLLLENKCAFNVLTKKQKLPLHYSCRHKNFKQIKVFVQVINESNSPLLNDLINKKDGNKMTPLHYAVGAKSLDTVKELLKCNYIDLNKKNLTSNTPLHDAILKGCFDIALYLIENGCNINAKNGIVLKLSKFLF